MVKRRKKDLFAIPLTRDEERICILCLATKYEKEAREALIIHNLRLVVFLADKIYEESCRMMRITKDELISDGQLGLVKAAGTFSMEKHIRFTTYAYRCIQNQMLQDVRTVQRLEKNVPLQRWTTAEIPENLLDSQLWEDPVYEYVFQKITKERVGIILRKLTEQEKIVIDHRYFRYEDEEKITQKQLAKRLGISQSYASRLEKNVLDKIKKQVNCGTI